MQKKKNGWIKMANKKIKITIIWGTDKEKTQTYTFENKEQAKFFMDGVDESNGWLEYEVKRVGLINKTNARSKELLV